MNQVTEITPRTDDYVEIDVDAITKERDNLLTELVTVNEELLAIRTSQHTPYMEAEPNDHAMVKLLTERGYNEVPSLSKEERADKLKRFVAKKTVSPQMQRCLQTYMDYQCQQTVQAMYQLARAQVGGEAGVLSGTYRHEQCEQQPGGSPQQAGQR